MATSQVTKVVTNVRMSSFELSVFLNYFNQTLNCSTDFGKTGNIKFHENPSTLNLVVLYRTAGHAGRLKKKNTAKGTVAFCNSATAPKRADLRRKYFKNVIKE